MKKEFYTFPTLRIWTVNVASVLMQSVTVGNASGSDATMDAESDFDSFFGS